MMRPSEQHGDGGRRRLVLVAPFGAQHELRLGHIEAFESKAKHKLVPIGQQSFGQKINAQQKCTAPKGKETEIDTKARNAVVVRLFSRATHRYIYANVCVCVCESKWVPRPLSMCHTIWGCSQKRHIVRNWRFRCKWNELWMENVINLVKLKGKYCYNCLDSLLNYYCL